jgi:nitrite reductase (NADH) large subunit
VLLVNAEPGLPYKRTKVSKSVASGYGADDFAVHYRDWYRETGITLLSGEPVTGINAADRTITVGGIPFVYGELLLATGSRPRIPFENLPAGRWSTLWTSRDGLNVHNGVTGRRRAVIVGVGVLGVEAAWQMVEMGLETTMVGRSLRPMAKFLDDDTAAVLRRKIESRGVNMCLNHTVSDVGVDESTNDVVITTSEGELKADFGVLAVGCEPEVSLARASGIDVNHGVLVDRTLRTSVPGIWAAGDCAEHVDGYVSGLWHSAEHQGRWAANSMLGVHAVYSPPPFRLKCEAFGGLFFSAGPVNVPVGESWPDPAESWESGDALWRPRFQQGRLVSLAGASDSPIDKTDLKKIQGLLLEGANRDLSRRILVP